MAKLKEYRLTTYYKAIEFVYLAVTTSRKKFAELTGVSEHHIKQYGASIEPRTPECIQNPNILYAEPGLGGEVRYICERDKVKLYSEYKAFIDKHRETYANYTDYLEKTNADS